ncbi:hypothetical protein ACDX66_13550 [Peribacillus frigoritolerans]
MLNKIVVKTIKQNGGNIDLQHNGLQSWTGSYGAAKAGMCKMHQEGYVNGLLNLTKTKGQAIATDLL